MKSKVISTISALFFAGAIAYFALGIFQETKLGEKNTKSRFDTLLLTTKNLAEIEKITSSEFKSGFFSAIGDFSDFSEIKLSIDDNCVYSYPSVENKLTNTFAHSKKFISKKSETATVKNIVRSPVDGEDLTYDLTLSAGIYKIKQNTIYNNAKVSFVLAFLGTILSVIALLSRSGSAESVAMHDAEAKKREAELLAKIREQKQQIDEMQTQQYYDESDDDFDDDFYDEEDADAETAVSDEPAENANIAETVAIDAAEQSETEPTENEGEEQVESEQVETESAEQAAIEEPETEEPAIEQVVIEQTETEQEENVQPEEESTAEEQTDATENATEEPVAEEESDTEKEPVSEENSSAVELKKEEAEPEKPETDESEPMLDETNENEGESSSEPVLEQPLADEENAFDTIGTDIASPKTFMKDLEEQLKQNTYNEISLALVKITDFDWDSFETEEKAKEIIALSKENFGEESEIYKSDEPNTLGIVLNGVDLNEAISECEKMLPAIKEVLDSLGGEHKVHIGISAMNYRAIPPERIMLEAKGALNEAESDPENPIVAFKANPDLYKKEIGNELESER